jgi:ribosomal protein S18 acetylase RimI-like enzyme
VTGDAAVRRAGAGDAADVARLLDAFNREFDDYTPGVAMLTERVSALLAAGEITVLLCGSEPAGFAQLRFFPSVWSDGPEAYLEELYVSPARRGGGLGRALLEAAIAHARERGAVNIDLNTSEDDTVAIGLYERTGFTNREGRPDGPKMLYYEREL